VADEARFCGYCGAAAGDSQPGLDSSGAARRPSVDYWVCPQCSVENEVGGAYCVSCGAGAPLATPVASIATTSAGPQPLTGGRPRRRWPIAVAAFLGVALIAVAAVAFIHGVGGSGDGVPSTPADAATGATGDGTTDAQSSPSPSPPGGGEQAGTPTSWKGIGTRLATPFWGAFYCAGGNKQKAIEAAQVGKDAGMSTLVLWTGDYGSIRRSGDEMWVICAGPFSSQAEAQRAVDRMRADARELRSRAPDLDIHFGSAYARLVQ